MSLLSARVRGLLRLVAIDAACAACGARTAAFCAECRIASGIPEAGARCALMGGRKLWFLASYWCRRVSPPVPTPAVEALLRFKHRADRQRGRSLARAFATALTEHARTFDAVVAIPASSTRARARALDPAAWFARALAARGGVAFRSRLLQRRRDVRPQRGLGGAQRRSNVRGAFGTCAAVPDGYSLLLIDDVCTTGSTLGEAAAALEAAGAARVELAVLACADMALCRQCPSMID
ncbi:MAG TPA: phosphoribosyltransferase family protein [Candidatus Limnocylindrales bacterium]|nr:phosphoribosyltransferase family protein [Candidatus Limnocylindrales bacterium]